MNRFMSLLLIVFMTLSSVSAHAGMFDAAIGQDHASMMAYEHADHETMAMVHDDASTDSHSGHQLGCGLGHCAIACGFLLQQFAFATPENVGSSKIAYTERLLVGGTTAFEPPPPKV